MVQAVPGLWLACFLLKLLVANSYGAVADAITPGEKVGGELVRLVQIRKFLGYSTGEAAILLAIQKALSLSALVLLNLVVVATMASHVSFCRRGRYASSSSCFSSPLAPFFSLIQNRCPEQAAGPGKNLAQVVLAFANWVEEFARQTETIRQKRGECLFQLALAVLIWAIFPLKLVLLILPHTGSIPTLVLFGTAFLSYFAGMIPLLPGGLGTFEATIGGILNAYGLALNQAVAVTVVFRFITFWFVLLLSLLVIGGYRVFLFAQRRGVHASRE